MPLLIFILALLLTAPAVAQDIITVKFTDDFVINGNGSSDKWQLTGWTTLQPDQTDPRQTRVKILYSAKGIYTLFHCEDTKISATKTSDFDRLWTEDVAEVFLWPDTSASVYFEYEISPLNKELVLLVPNISGRHGGWQPWAYKGRKTTKHLTLIERNDDSPGAVTAWFAEMFIPYELLYPLASGKPAKGNIWKANFYRVDYDNEKAVNWSWKKTDRSFHEFGKFGRIMFD